MFERFQTGSPIPRSKSFWNSALGAGRKKNEGRTPTASGTEQQIGRYAERLIFVRNSGQTVILAGRLCRVYKPKKPLGDNSRDLVLGDTIYEIVSYGNGDPIAASFCRTVSNLEPGHVGRAYLIPGGPDWDVPIASAGGGPNYRKPPVWRWFAGLPYGGISFITQGRYVSFPATDDTSKFVSLSSGIPVRGTQPAMVPGYEILKIIPGTSSNYVTLRKAHTSQMYVRGSCRFYYEQLRVSAGVSGYFYPGFTITINLPGNIVLGQALIQPILFNRCIADFPVGATNVSQLFDNDLILEGGESGSIPPAKLIGLVTITFDFFWDSQELSFSTAVAFDTDFTGTASGASLPTVKYAGCALDFLELRRNDNTNEWGQVTEPTIGSGGENFAGDFGSPAVGPVSGSSLLTVAGSIGQSAGTGGGTGGGPE